MIIALPAPPAGKTPTLSHLKETRNICMRHGFITYPQFLDNRFITENKADVEWLEKNLKRFGQGLIQFAVSPDYMVETSIKLKNKYPSVNWIYPLHDPDEDISQFEWVGYIHDSPRRNYDLKKFLQLTEGKKRWYLGYWDSQHPRVIPIFDGLDTTMPFYLAGKLGQTWIDWKRHKTIGKLLIPTEELLEFNIISFKIAIIELYAQRNKHTVLSQFTTKGEDDEGMG